MVKLSRRQMGDFCFYDYPLMSKKEGGTDMIKLKGGGMGRTSLWSD